jgi:hypothetical protein
MHTYNLLSAGGIQERDPMGELVRVREFLAAEHLDPLQLQQILHRQALTCLEAIASGEAFGTYKNEVMLFVDDPDSVQEISGTENNDGKRTTPTSLGSFVALQAGRPVGYVKVAKKDLPGFDPAQHSFVDGSLPRTDVSSTHLVNFWVSTVDYDLPGTVLGTVAELARQTNSSETAYCLVAPGQELSTAFGRCALSTSFSYPWSTRGEQVVALVCARQPEEESVSC